MNYVAPQERQCRLLDGDGVCSDSGKRCSFLNDLQGQKICEEVTIECAQKKRGKEGLVLEESRKKISRIKISDGADVDERVEQFLKERYQVPDKIPTL